MFSPYVGFTERDIAGLFIVPAPAASGLAMDILTSDSSPLSPSPYANALGSIGPAGGSGAFTGLTELGYLIQPVTTDGPTLFSVLSSIYDESIPEGGVAGLVLPKAGALIATDQFVSSGTGAIKFDGTVALGTACGFYAGQARQAQSGDTVRLKFLGQLIQRGAATASFQIL